MSRPATDAVIMKIYLIVLINRRANDTFKSLIAFAGAQLEGPGESSPSVNTCDINMPMSN